MVAFEPQHVIAMGQDAASGGFSGQLGERRWFGIRRAQPLESAQGAGRVLEAVGGGGELQAVAFILRGLAFAQAVFVPDGQRSEERRVGKEGRSRWSRE